MKAVGVVAEYNPFHNGHARHLSETKCSLSSDTPVVCVMSGSWVQRGECALTDKWTRVSMALRGGADLVLELPLPWAISSAEWFARGAVATLKATGVVGMLSFGSESGRSGDLCRIAEALDSPEYQKALRAELDKGISFAEARQRAVARMVGKEAALLEGPNDSLGVEYIRAAGKDLAVTVVPRQGTGHDSLTPGREFASATYLRELTRQGREAELSGWMAKEDAALLKNTGIARMEQIERAVLARLRQMDETDFAALPDSGAAEGLPARLCRAAEQAGSLEEFYALAKTKRYAHSRIRRLALWAFLGLTEADRPDRPAYLRVLGFNSRGQEVLREMKTAAALPILTKPAHSKALSYEAQKLFALECRGTDLFGLCFDTPKPKGLDFTTGPVIL